MTDTGGFQKPEVYILCPTVEGRRGEGRPPPPIKNVLVFITQKKMQFVCLSILTRLYEIFSFPLYFFSWYFN